MTGKKITGWEIPTPFTVLMADNQPLIEGLRSKMSDPATSNAIERRLTKTLGCLPWSNQSEYALLLFFERCLPNSTKLYISAHYYDNVISGDY